MRRGKRGRASDVATLCDVSYESYLEHLKALVSLRSVVTDEEALTAAIEHVRASLARALTPVGWTSVTDAAGNVRCLPPHFDASRPALWLNAHIDTVDAAPSDFAGRDPFTCFETPTHLIGRGANDCKAGVAFVLWTAERIGRGELLPFNGGFLITRREEAGSSLPRTAPQFAADMASGVLPVSSLPRSTFVWFLENTVSLASHLKAAAPEVAIYDRERHSFSLLCRGSLHALGRALLRLESHEEWKTVAVWPVASSTPADDPKEKAHDDAAGAPAAWPQAGIGMDAALEVAGLPASALVVKRQEGGHSCTVRNADNLIFGCLVREAMQASEEDAQAIEALPAAALTAWVATTVHSAAADAGGGDAGGGGDDDERIAMLWSGIASQPTRVATSVTALPLRATSRGPAEHVLSLNYRGLQPVTQVVAQMDSLRQSLGGDCVRWFAGADLSSGQGAQQSEFLASSLLPALVEEVEGVLDAAVTVKYEPNPGRSDASHLWRSLPDELRGERVVPFTCGPGHRSHRCPADGVMRKTHGPNEGFDKATGKVCLPFFVELLGRFANPPAGG